MKLYLYDSNFNYIGEVTAYAGVEYPNSTDIAPDFSRDRDIYNYKFSPALKEWEYEYRYEFVNQKAKELGLEIYQISAMSEQDLRSGKLPVLDTIQKKQRKAKKGE